MGMRPDHFHPRSSHLEGIFPTKQEEQLFFLRFHAFAEEWGLEMLAVHLPITWLDQLENFGGKTAVKFTTTNQIKVVILDGSASFSHSLTRKSSPVERARLRQKLEMPLDSKT
jgi:hypothetical protein